MKRRRQFDVLLVIAAVTCLGGQLLGQGTPTPSASGTPAAAVASATWAYSLTVDGYIVPNDNSYASPVLTGDRTWLHLEARYNYEDQRTGSLWLGRNFSAGKKLQWAFTPMIGGVFGHTTGIAPGCEFSLTYKKVQFSSSSEYIFDTTRKAGNFFYSWPELTYSPIDWFKVGTVAQRTKAFHTRFDTQRGFLVGVTHKKVEFTTYIFDPGWADPTAVLEVGYSF